MIVNTDDACLPMYYYTLSFMSWCDFENELLKEFQSILTQFNSLKDEINEDTRKDFLGLLQYMLKSRKSFRSVAKLHCFNYQEDENTFPVADIAKFVSELIDKDLDSFALEYSNFPLILNSSHLVPTDSLTELCVKYWKHRYPSIKTSFIIPLCTRIPLQSSDLKSLLTRRLLKGKLDPFDDSIQLCKILGISPEDTEFYDPHLAALKDLLRNHQQLQIEQSCALLQSGCHCD